MHYVNESPHKYRSSNVCVCVCVFVLTEAEKQKHRNVVLNNFPQLVKLVRTHIKLSAVWALLNSRVMIQYSNQILSLLVDVSHKKSHTEMLHGGSHCSEISERRLHLLNDENSPDSFRCLVWGHFSSRRHSPILMNPSSVRWYFGVFSLPSVKASFSAWIFWKTHKHTVTVTVTYNSGTDDIKWMNENINTILQVWEAARKAPLWKCFAGSKLKFNFPFVSTWCVTTF